jgi:hypothetical protein
MIIPGFRFGVFFEKYLFSMGYLNKQSVSGAEMRAGCVALIN